MAYDYQEMKKKLFTEENQSLFLEIRDKVHRLLAEAGAVKMEFIMDDLSGGSWEMLACVDRLVELGEIEEITYGGCLSNDRIFIEKDIPE